MDLKLNKSVLSYVFTGILAGMVAAGGSASAQSKARVKLKPQTPVSVGKNGHLEYTPDAEGNRIPDFSYAGYMGGDAPIPDVPVRVTVSADKGDATLRIQSALNYVASLPVDKNGFRGAVLLGKGTFEVDGGLKINASGVVLRGSGMGADGTVVIGGGLDRQTLISVDGKDDRKVGEAIKISDAYVPVNANKVQVAEAQSFKSGDQVLIHRPSTKEWIDKLGTATFGGGISALGWKPGDRDIFWDRKVVAVEGSSVVLDAPLTTALDAKYGGGTIAKYQWQGRISKVGIENLSLVSTYDQSNPKDEAHRWMAITMENLSDAWVRRVVFKHFAGSAVAVLSTAKKITIEDCKSLQPISEVGGQRRNTFFTAGQQTLFQRIYSEYGFHDFAVGFCASLNAFVQCDSHLPYSFSGAIDSWSSGNLFDIVNIDGNNLSYANREQDGQGAGWSAANSMFWQCTAAQIDCYKPPTANNWAYGSWAQFGGDGYWESSNESIQPRSFYYAQLSDRLGKSAAERGFVFDILTNATSSPTVQQAAELTALSKNPRITLSEWIDQIIKDHPIALDAVGAKKIEQIGINKSVAIKWAEAMHVQNGLLVRGNSIITGDRQQVPWWNGTVQPDDLKKAKPAITRYVPGRTGTGLTDDLNEVTDSMVSQHIVGMEQNYGLWYDRRRDDHERIRRRDGDVWPPFYELPFARSGKVTPWDGLTKYYLTKYNTWYWSRLKQFADLADQKGLLLIHHNYFQHNIIEAGAHYVDFPWRPVNNINHTGFPEPPAFAGDKRIFMGEQFYDETNPARRELHKAFIRKCLDNFRDNNGVIQLIGEEFTGPLHFVQFWLDVIRDWEKETGKKEIIGLSTTKDVQDSILADPIRLSVVDVIDIRFWHYDENGTAYAPLGGQSLAPRQQARLFKPKKTSFEQVYRAVSEYRQKYPDKAVIYSGDSYDSFGWAVFMAGGSLADIPVTDKAFLKDAASMQPFNSSEDNKGQWALTNKEHEFVIYNNGLNTLQSPLEEVSGTFKIHWIDTKTGKITSEEKIKGGKKTELKQPAQGPVVLWISRV